MKRITPLIVLLIAAAPAFSEENEFIIHADAKPQEVRSTSNKEYETLFEIVDLEENPTLPEVAKISSNPSPAEPLIAHVEEEAKHHSGTIINFDAPKKEEVAINDVIVEKAAQIAPTSTIKINIGQVFAGSPLIYAILMLLSILAFFIWLYSQIHLRNLAGTSDTTIKNIRSRLTSNQFDDALALCQERDDLFCKMLAQGITTRKYGLQVMLETMRGEGKRATVKFWQKLSLLNDIAIIAPMVGLLGTVLGMFYAFYDVNRSVESITALFDGLGVSVGTTLAGLIVAIFAMMLNSMARYRLVKRLAIIENEAQSFATLIDHKPSF